MRKEIKTQLLENANQDYSDFSSALIPGCKQLIGVRLPQLRAMAKEIVKGDWKGELSNPEPDEYFEEVMLRGMISGYGSSKEKNLQEAFRRLDEYIPFVDNWSLCDSFCVSFTILEKHREESFQHLQQYLYSDKEFEVRVGLILLLNHFLKCDAMEKKMPRRMTIQVKDLSDDQETPGAFSTRILQTLNRPYEQGYYAMMAAAWLTAECFVTFPHETYTFLLNNQMDRVTYNKALQKICESRTPSDEVKQLIKGMKRL